ncbi:hypothetical protein JS528_00945 [Bifidobacterium sp. MA2]|uniref:Uncharacterized protein n=1 Tax=Bifidobacterium santillanense TaxID=2809028 RepID=A0ABS5UM18_9BIFI|nr:hypothetical protein [Bifidobacterium santillanense]MBT1171946.1 hypothetical protein [Bifidobacterium santillanense]
MSDQGFTFHDDVTSSQSDDPLIPAPDETAAPVDWDDPDQVLGMVASLKDQFTTELSGLAANVADTMLGGDVEALLAVTCAMADAMGELYATEAAILNGLLAARHPDWLPQVNGRTSMSELRRVMPDMVRVERAFVQLLKTGERQVVHLPDAGHDVSMTPRKDGTGVEFTIDQQADTDL